MRLLSELVEELIKQWQDGDAPINILIDDTYYDIEDFYFDKEIYEFIIKLNHGADYATRAEPAEAISWRIKK